MAMVKIEMESYLLLLPTILHKNLKNWILNIFLLKERCFWYNYKGLPGD